MSVLKPGTRDYRLVQDLREINKRVETIHPYTLLSLLPPERQFYKVLGIKDAFFSIPQDPVSQPIFCFRVE